MATDPMFQVAHNGPHGETLYASNPKLAAYKHAAHLIRCNITYQIIFHVDGSVTVTGTALAAITYEKEQKQ